jgi:hypothetical protein
MNSPTVHVLVMPMLFPKYDASSSEFGGRMSADYVHSPFVNGYVKMSYPTITRLSSGIELPTQNVFHFSLMMKDAWNNSFVPYYSVSVIQNRDISS